MEDKMITTDRVSTGLLRDMAVGGTTHVRLPDEDACRKGRLLAHAQSRALRCRFITTIDYNDRVLTITKTPRI